MKTANLKYSKIDHEVRRDFDISVLEYVVCDWVYVLSTNPESNFSGWCYAGKEQLAKDFGITKPGLLKLIAKMIDIGLIEKHPETRYLRTTRKWNIEVFTGSKQSLPQDNKVYEKGKQSLPLDSKQSLPNTIYIDNNINNGDLPESEINNKKQTSIKVLFCESKWSDFETLKFHLAKDSDFVLKYSYTDLKHYIQKADTWSENNQVKRTDRGWLMTLRDWISEAELSKNRVMIERPKSNTEDLFYNQ